MQLPGKRYILKGTKDVSCIQGQREYSLVPLFLILEPSKKGDMLSGGVFQ